MPSASPWKGNCLLSKRNGETHSREGRRWTLSPQHHMPLTSKLHHTRQRRLWSLPKGPKPLSYLLQLLLIAIRGQRRANSNRWNRKSNPQAWFRQSLDWERLSRPWPLSLSYPLIHLLASGVLSISNSLWIQMLQGSRNSTHRQNHWQSSSSQPTFQSRAYNHLASHWTSLCTRSPKPTLSESSLSPLTECSNWMSLVRPLQNAQTALFR